MADDTAAKPRPKVKEPSKWANAPRQPDAAIIEKRRALWAAINEFVTKHGGWIVSPPGSVELRIEVPEHSPLPGKLIELGYRPLSIGQGTRLTAKSSAPSPWVVVDVISITLPEK